MRADGGSATVVVLMTAAIVALVGVGSGSLGMALTAREKAATAAEAAALAAAVATYPPASSVSPLSAAAQLTSGNGARLVSCVCRVDGSLRTRQVIVVAAVSVRVPIFGLLTTRRIAVAEFDPTAWLGG